jgi:hypothetical protein
MYAKMDTFRPSGAVSIRCPCKVTINSEFITVAYDDSGQTWQYRGQAKGPGDNELQAEGFDGRATLHRFEGSNVLEGTWVKDGVRGMWRIV